MKSLSYPKGWISAQPHWISKPGELRNDLDQFHHKLRLLARLEDSPEDIPDLLTQERQNHYTYAFELNKFKKKSTSYPPGPPALETQ